MLDSHLDFTEPTLVTTLPGGQNGLVFPLAPVYDLSLLKLVRGSLHIQCLSVPATNLIVELCIQLSDDAVTWPTSTTTPTSFTTAITGNSEGFVLPTAFEDITSKLTKK